MSERHIDLDDMDNSIPKARATGPANGPDPASVDDFATASESVWGSARRGAFPDVFRFFQERASRANPFDQFVPRDARQHFRSSQREFLLGWRSLIDYALERLDEQETRPVPSTNPNKIVVEEVDI